MRPALLILCLAVLGTAPASASEEEPRRGEEVYQQLCATCHGPYGRGKGSLSDRLERQPPDFTKRDWVAGRSAQQIVAALRGGHSPMAIGSVLEKQSLRDAVSFVLGLSKPGGSVSLRAGRDIYQSACWSCHGRDGDGQGPAAHGREPPPRDFTSDYVIEGREEEVARLIAEGAPHGPPDSMPAWAERLSKQEIRDVVAYLKTFTQR